RKRVSFLAGSVKHDDERPVLSLRITAGQILDMAVRSGSGSGEVIRGRAGSVRCRSGIEAGAWRRRRRRGSSGNVGRRVRFAFGEDFDSAGGEAARQKE